MAYHIAAAAAAVIAAGAIGIGVCSLLPAAAPAVAMMKAPGAVGFIISRAAFVANPQLYFELLRNAGAVAAAAAFAA